MADVTEALERLADLRDRGILTQAEFDVQKAALLSPAAPTPPPAAPAAPPAARAGGLGPRIALIVGGLVVVVGVLWALGIVRVPHHSRPQTRAEIEAELKGDDDATPIGTPGGGATVASSAPAASAPAAGANPLIGEWTNDTAETRQCPARIAFAATTMTATTNALGSPQTDVQAVSYVVQSPSEVIVADGNGANARAPVQVENGHLTLMPGCTFHR